MRRIGVNQTSCLAGGEEDRVTEQGEDTVTALGGMSQVLVTALPLDPPPLVPTFAMAWARAVLPSVLSHRAVLILTPQAEAA